VKQATHSVDQVDHSFAKIQQTNQTLLAENQKLRRDLELKQAEVD
jgi:hypothetical protein